MNPWTIDARESVNDLEKVEGINDELIEQTPLIRKFFSEERYRFVIATKGFGKSLLLLTKRKKISGGMHLIIPEHEPLDVPSVRLDTLTKESMSLLKNENYFALIWSLSIVIAIIKRLNGLTDQEKQNASTSLKDILDNSRCNTVSNVFNFIIAELNRKQFFEDLVSDYNKTLLPIIRNIKTPVFVFIDNVDECFENDRGVWYTAQNGLIKTIYDLCRCNSKLNLFASIRKEAFLKIDTEMLLQYKGVSLDLSYSKNELEDIFIRNIMKDDINNSMKRDLIRTSPIVAFIGTDKVSHGIVIEEEDTFDYIYRHTLQRPRDLMEIGGEISKCIPSIRNPETKEGLGKFKALVNSAATNIATQYLGEVMPHLTIKREDLDKVFELIDSNILEEKRLKEICIEFNGDDAGCTRKDCKVCTSKIHIFCELYKIGLLGHVYMIPTAKGQYIQKFVPVGEKTFHEVRLLPDSTHYLIHPILDELIRQKSKKYKHHINDINIVGYDRAWKSTKEISSESIDRPTVFISSTKDLSQYRDAIEEVVKNKNFAPIRSETINSPVALEKCKELARNCTYFVAILGSRYGIEWEKISICEHEFDAAYKEDPQKIIVYVSEGDIANWDRKQKEFVERVQNLDRLGYARGDRVNILNIKGRFDKDIVERIAKLSKRHSE